MLVYFIRHGQSVSNLNHIVCGQADVPLTERGIQEAQKAGHELNSINFDRIFSSDLQRAVMTAKIALPGCNPEQLKIIRELDTGILTGRFVAELCEKELNDYQKKAFQNYCGESLDMQRERVRKFKTFLEGLVGCDRVAVFSHEWVIFNMIRLTICDGTTPSGIFIENGSIVVFEFLEGEWKLRKLTSYQV